MTNDPNKLLWNSSEYFKSLPFNIQEQIMQSASSVNSIEDVERMAQNLMDGGNLDS